MICLNPCTPNDRSKHRPHRLQLCFAFFIFAMASCTSKESNNPNAQTELKWQTTSKNGLYVATLEPFPSGTPIPIGPFHPWTIQLHDAKNNPVSSAAIRIDGGMPSHGHGLPSQPEVTQHIGDGRFLIEGMRFNMAGDWVIDVWVQSAAGTDTVNFEIKLAH